MSKDKVDEVLGVLKELSDTESEVSLRFEEDERYLRDEEGHAFSYNLSNCIRYYRKSAKPTFVFFVGTPEFDKVASALCRYLAELSGLDSAPGQDHFHSKKVCYISLDLKEGDTYTEARESVYLEEDIKTIETLEDCCDDVHLYSNHLTSLGSIKVISGYLFIYPSSGLRDLDGLDIISGIYFLDDRGDQIGGDYELKDLKDMLSKVDSIPREDLPLHLNDSNLLVRNKVKYLLEC
jgi:hypothetical protein